MKVTSAIFGGAGLGALIGILIGMSTSGTVGIIIGAISSVLLVLLGFKEQSDPIIQAIRVGSFGFSCIICILIGLYLRVNNSFTPSVKSEVDRWTNDTIFTKEEAKMFFLYDRFGFIPEGMKKDEEMTNDRAASVLYGKEIQMSDCQKAKGYQDYPLENELKAYKKLGGLWERISEAVSKDVPIDDQKNMLNLMRKCFCDEKN